MFGPDPVGMPDIGVTGGSKFMSHGRCSPATALPEIKDFEDLDIFITGFRDDTPKHAGTSRPESSVRAAVPM